MRQSDIDRELESFYSAGSEGARLESSSPAGVAEFLRVQTLVRAQLAALGALSPLWILDVGGATGIHSEWLAADGHQVTLIDPVVSQVEVARRVGTFDARVGDARSLPSTTANSTPSCSSALSITCTHGKIGLVHSVRRGALYAQMGLSWPQGFRVLQWLSIG